MYNNVPDFKDMGEFEDIPNGEYIGIVTSMVEFVWVSGQKHDATNSNAQEDSNYVVEAKIKIINGKFTDRIVFDNFRFWSENKKVRGISKSNYKKLAIAVGIDLEETPNTPYCELTGKIFGFKIVNTESKGKTYQNIKDYIKLDDAASYLAKYNENNVVADKSNIDDDIPF